MTTSEPREPREYRPPTLIDPPSRSIIWIATWFLIGLVGATLLVAAGPSGVPSSGASWTAIRGFGFWLFLPIVSLVTIVLLSVSAVRRAPAYREQRASPEGQALQHDMDVALAAKPRVVLQVVGVILTILFALVFIFVILELMLETVDVSVIVIDVIALLVVGLPAAGTLSVAQRRRASARRIDAG